MIEKCETEYCDNEVEYEILGDHICKECKEVYVIDYLDNGQSQDHIHKIDEI